MVRIEDIFARYDSKPDPEPLFVALPKSEWLPFNEFVGYIDENGIIHEGEAIPAPVDAVTGEFKGILWYQDEGFNIIEYNDNILILWPRGHGKTWLLAWYIEWNMKHSVYKAMYLSITDVINDVADWVYEWAFANGLLAEGDNVEKAIRRNTPKSFRLVNGSKFKIYSIMDKAIRGKHDYTIFMDDIIEEGSQTHPSYQRMAERRWNSTISKIRRNKLIIVNTRVYEGDLIEYLMKQFANKHEIMIRKKPEDAEKWRLVCDLKTPYVFAEEGDPQDEDGFLLDKDGRRVLLAPELYDHEHFDAMLAQDFESFMAEMMQNPTSIQGGMLDPEDIQFEKRPHYKHDNVQMVGIGVDLSWADEAKDPDMCGVISMAMWHEGTFREFFKRFTVVKETVEVLPLYDYTKNGKLVKGVFTIIGEHFAFLQKFFPGVPLIIAIERNSGGTIVIKVAQREKFKWVRHCIPDKNEAVKWDKDGNANIPLGITHKKNKIVRIFGELQHSTKSGETKLDWSCESGVLFAQLVAFPKGKHDDGPDAEGMIKDELNRRWTPPRDPVPREDPYVKVKQAQAEKSFEEMRQPWLKDQRKLAQLQNRKKRLY